MRDRWGAIDGDSPHQVCGHILGIEGRLREVIARNEQLLKGAQHWLTVGRENDELTKKMHEVTAEREDSIRGSWLYRKAEKQIATLTAERYLNALSIFKPGFMDAARHEYLKARASRTVTNPNTLRVSPDWLTQITIYGMRLIIDSMLPSGTMICYQEEPRDIEIQT